MKRNVVVLALLLAQEPAGDASKIKSCDRSCLTGVMDRYVETFVRKNPSGVPVAPETRFTENTAQIDVGEGFLWKGKIELTAFKIYVADPVAGFGVKLPAAPAGNPPMLNVTPAVKPLVGLTVTL